MWGGCCCDFDFVGVLYGVILLLFLIVNTLNCKCKLLCTEA